MSFTATGRQRTVTFANDITSGASANWIVVDTGFFPGRYEVQRNSSAKGRGVVAALGMEFSFLCTEGGSVPPPTDTLPVATATGNHGGQGRLRFVAPIPALTMGDVTDTGTVGGVGGTFGRPGSYGPLVNDGSASFFGTFEEYWEVYFLDPTEAVYLPDPLDPNSVGYPPFGGNAQPDGLPAIGVRLVEVAKIGTQIGATASMFGQSYSIHIEIVAGNQFELVKSFGGGIDYGWRPLVRMDVTNTSSTVSVSGDLNGVPLVVSPPYAGSAGGQSWTAAGIVSATASAPISGASVSTPSYCICAATVFPQKVYRLLGTLRAWDQAYPYSGLSISTTTGAGDSTACAPTCDQSLYQRRFHAEAEYNGITVPGVTVDQHRPLRTWLSGMVQTGTTEDPELNDREDRRDHRTYIHGPRWEAGTLSHAASRAFSASWDETVLDDATPTATGAFAGIERVQEGYRYYTLALTLVGADKTVTVSLSNGAITKEYEIRATVGAGVYEIDTCSPSNVPTPFDMDRRDGRYPLTPQTIAAHSPIATGPEEDAAYLGGLPEADTEPESVRGWLWGVNRPETITVTTALDSGETLTIGAYTGVRKSRARLTMLDSFKGAPEFNGGAVVLWPMTAAGAHTTEVGRSYGGQFGVVEVDGRVSTDFAGSWYTEFDSGGFSWEFPSVGAFGSWWDAFPGFDWTPATSFPKAALGISNDWLALCLCGSGATYAGTTPEYWVNRSLGTETTLYADFLFDELDDFPQCGDYRTFGAYDVATPIPVCKHLRAQAWGIAFDSDTGLPRSGVTVTTEEDGSPDIPSGNGVTDPYGAYISGTPWGRAPREHTTTLDATYDTIAWRNRRRERTSFRVVIGGAGKVIAFLSVGDGSLFRIVDKSGTVHLGHSDVPDRQDWLELPLSLTATEASLQKGKGNRRVFGLIDSGTLTLYIDASEGRDGPTNTMTEGAATSHDVCSFGDGSIAVLRIDGGAVKITLRNSRDLSLIAGPYTTNVTGLPGDATIRGDDVRLANNVPALVVTIGQGSSTDTYLTTDLRTLTA